MLSSDASIDKVSSVDACSEWFRRFLEPCSVETFLGEYWVKKPLRWTPMDVCGIQSMFTFEDARARLRFSPADQKAVRMVYRGRTLSPENYANGAGNVDMDRMEEFLDAGASLDVNFVNRNSRHLRWYARQFDQSLRTSVILNLCCMPAHARGHGRQVDEHGVFVVQLEGSKRWSLHEEGGPTEHVLKSGDALYLPRGLEHEERCDEEGSVHLTIRLHALDWYVLLQKALDETAKQEDLHALVPIEWLRRSELHQLEGRLVQLLDRVKEQCRNHRYLLHYLAYSSPAAPLVDRCRAVATESRLARDESLKWQQTPLGVLSLRHKNDQEPPLLLKGGCASVLSFLNGVSEFRPVDLPGLSHEDARLFCHYLRLNGFVRLFDEPANTNAEPA